jgi:hypothetical protein
MTLRYDVVQLVWKAMSASFGRAREGFMSAIIEEEIRVVVEDRIARIESDVAELRGDVKAIGARLSQFMTEVAKEFGAVRAEAAKESGSIRAELQSLRTSIERAKVWMLCTGVSTVLGVAAVVGLKLH